MRLSELWGNDKQTMDTNSITSTSSGNAGVQRQMQSMVPGQTIQGEVIGRNGGEVQIRLAEDMVLNARLEKSINLEIGKNMTFQVMNNGKTLTLSPLFANMATDANVYKAIDMAGLPLNGKTVEMTNGLMEAGMPIDKNTLQQVYREINAYMTSGEDIRSIVELHRLGLPVNADNVNQMTSYRNLTHQLLGGMNRIMDALPEVFNRMLADANVEGAAKLYEALLTMNTSAASSADGMPSLLGEGILTGTETLNGEGTIINKGALPDSVIPMNVENVMLLNEEGEPHIQGKTAAETSGMQEQVGQHHQTSEGNRIPEASLDRTTPNQVTEDMIKQLMQRMVEKGGPQRQEFSKALLDGLKNQWTLSPEQVATEGEVEELYNRLDKQLKILSKALEGTGQTDTVAYKAVRNMSQNIDFMQQLNQAYTYVQLPLRLHQGEAHGDLYVYTNKKHLASEDGSVSALLHLDMEHLGPVDLYVAMEQQKVNTKFYVADEEMLDFLGEHMDILTDRLKKRGYDCDCAMQLRQTENKRTGGIDGLIRGEGQTPIAMYAFDVRT